MKITVVGAGAVGESCEEYIAIKNFASEVVILDIKEGFAEGKAMDLMQTASLNNFDTKIILRISGKPKLNIFRYLFWNLALRKIYKITFPTIETLNHFKKLKIIDEDKFEKTN